MHYIYCSLLIAAKNKLDSTHCEVHHSFTSFRLQPVLIPLLVFSTYTPKLTSPFTVSLPKAGLHGNGYRVPGGGGGRRALLF